MQRKELIASLTNEEAELILHDWKFWARPEQLEPQGNWKCWLIKTGRGWGKTRTGAEWVIERVNAGYRRIALIGQSKADVRDTMIELGESSILKVAPPWDMPEYEPSKRRLNWKNGAVATVYSGDEPDQLRGPQHDTGWIDELAKFKYPQETWDNFELGLRLSNAPRACITTTPRPLKVIKDIIKSKDTITISGNSLENRINLPKSFIDKIIEKYQGTRLGRQELDGEVLTDTPGALWTLELIDKYRVQLKPDLVRIVIGIDPEAVSTEGSAETGIIGAGLGLDGHGYILDDSSLRASPSVWASTATKLFYTLKADRVIAEVNNGGEMVENTIKVIDKNIPYKAVSASRGKLTRAEPVSALYEQGRIHHVGCFPELEDQMTSWTPGDKSPDRMDALVWAITELMLGHSDQRIL